MAKNVGPMKDTPLWKLGIVLDTASSDSLPLVTAEKVRSILGDGATIQILGGTIIDPHPQQLGEKANGLILISSHPGFTSHKAKEKLGPLLAKHIRTITMPDGKVAAGALEHKLQRLLGRPMAELPTSEEPTPPEAPARRRGRPRKDNSAPEKPKVLVTEAPKKRGRPRKNPVAAAAPRQAQIIG